ncbi:MAG: TIM barrel protein [Planctomycetota bacterium]
MAADRPTEYKFSFGPWNISTGEDPFGPAVRNELTVARKLKMYKELGFDYVQFHDDDVVPDVDVPWGQIEREAKKVKKVLDGEGLTAEFVAPRNWFHTRTIDGAYTSNSAADRKYALERSKRAVDIANLIGTDRLVLWLAREGTYCREAKDPVTAIGRIVDAMNTILEHDPKIRILGEMKPNEPMDQAYLPTPGHFMGLVYKTVDPSRVGVLIESAHSILAGLDPSDDMAYVLWHQKLWGVHLNDQNGLKYDQDKTFGSVDLRRAFNQVYVLERAGYGRNGEVIGLDIKAMRTTKVADRTKHLSNSKEIFLRLVDLVRSLDHSLIDEFRSNRDYESLELYIVKHLMGAK